MMQIFYALLLGVVAGLIDALPMIKGSPKFAVLLVFSQWILLGLTIPFVGWAIQPWLKGLILGLLGMVPIMILVWPRSPKRIPLIAMWGLGLGAAIGYVGSLIVR